jgi:hypothetical protein
MRTIGGAVMTAVCGAAFMLMALPGIPAAASPGGTGGMQHGVHAGMERTDRGKMTSVVDDVNNGERIFAGKVGPWTGEARLVDMMAQMLRSGVTAKTAARFAGRRHLMLFLTDPTTGKHAPGIAGKVVVTGPGKASSSNVTLVVMGEHIGADIDMRKPGKYTFKADIESAGGKGSATFSYTLR